MYIYNINDKSCLNIPDSEAMYHNLSEYIIIPEELIGKPLVYADGILSEDLSKSLSQAISQAQSQHTNNHLAYQSKPFVLNTKGLNLYFNCTDDTRKNFESAQKVAESQREVYFYDGLGNGDWLNLEEMSGLGQQFNDRLNPSFVIKGKGKLAINKADLSSVISLADKYNLYFNKLYELLNTNTSSADIRKFLEEING